MCGLLGYINHKEYGFDNEQINQVETLYLVNQFRGNHSTGFVSVTKDGTGDWFKTMGGAFHFLNSPFWKDRSRNLFKNGQGMFGHGRMASKGSISIANAHPFVSKKASGNFEIIGVHNGTIYSADEPLTGLDKYEVDSEWLIAKIAEHGAENVLPHIYGGTAVMWWDSEHKTFNLWRNDGRPLHFAQMKNGPLLIQSEWETLQYVKDKHNLKYEDGKVYTFLPHTLYTLPLEKFVDGYEGFETKDLKAVVRPYTGGRTPVADEVTDIETFNQWAAYELGTQMESCERPEERSTATPLALIHQRHGLPRTPNHRDEFGFLPTSGTTYPGQRTINDVAALTSSQRSLLSDMRSIADGRIVSVEWQDGIRHTLFVSGTKDVAFIPPYEPLLRKLAKGEKPNYIIKYYASDKEHGNPVPIEINLEKLSKLSGKSSIQTEKEKRKEYRRSLREKYQLEFPFKPGESIRFHSKINEKLIRHTAKCGLMAQHPEFVAYENDMDGKIKIGDRVQVEICDIEILNKEHHIYKVICTRIKPVQDKTLDFWFHETSRDIEQIKRMAFFEGEIARIEPSTKAQHEDSGGLVRIHLANPIQLIDVSMTKLFKDENDGEASHQVIH